MNTLLRFFYPSTRSQKLIRALHSGFGKGSSLAMTTNSSGLAIINQVLTTNGPSQETIVDESSFDGFCKRAFDGADTADSEISPKQLFRRFDLNQDGKLNTGEERNRLNKWLQDLANRKSALVVVDVQNDFINGPLSIRDGPARQEPEAVIDPINRLVDSIPFDLIVYTQDWHPPNHISFIESVDKRPIDPDSKKKDGWKVGELVPFFIGGRVIKEKVWPAHCIRDTKGAQMHPRLRVIDDERRVLRIYKSQDPDAEQFSGFFNNQGQGETKLHRELCHRGITDLYLCGLAYDVCVAWTAQDALSLGYKVAVIDDCSRGLDLERIQEFKKQVLDRYGVILQSKEIPDLVAGKRVPWSWAYATAVRALKA